MRHDPFKHYRDPTSAAPMSAAFATHTAPAAAAGAMGPAQWARQEQWGDPAGLAGLEQGNMKGGVVVRVSPPMGRMDDPPKARGLDGIAISARGRRALAEMPWWRRGLLSILLWVAGGVGRLARRVEGKRTGELPAGTPPGGSPVVTILPKEKDR